MFLLPFHPLPYWFEWERTQIKRLKNEEINVAKNTPKLFCTHLHTLVEVACSTRASHAHTHKHQWSKPSHTIMSSRTPRINMQHHTHVTRVTTWCCHVSLNTTTLPWHIHGNWLIYKIRTRSNCYLSCMRNILRANGSHTNMGLIIRRLLLLLLISPLYAYLL